MMNVGDMADGLDVSILAPAFLAGVIVLLTHIPLGREVVKRGIIFIDLAIAQIAGLGVIIAFQFGWEMHGLEAQIAAVTSALLGAWLLHSIEKKAGEHLEALIGVSFVLAATASILMLAHNPHGSEHIKELLVGQILWVDWSQILIAAVISLIVVFVWFNYKNKIGNIGFYILFAVYRVLYFICRFYYLSGTADWCVPGVYQFDSACIGCCKISDKTRFSSCRYYWCHGLL
jgi:zinc/manganese transport system permease protein